MDRFAVPGAASLVRFFLFFSFWVNADGSIFFLRDNDGGGVDGCVVDDDDDDMVHNDQLCIQRGVQPATLPFPQIQDLLEKKPTWDVLVSRHVIIIKLNNTNRRG